MRARRFVNSMKSRTKVMTELRPNYEHTYLVSTTSPFTRFSIGICASDDAPNLAALLELISADAIPQGFELTRIILVASACSSQTIDYVRRFSNNDERLLIIEEDERHGKADALNKIFERSLGDFLIFINADALPTEGSIGRLLDSIAKNESVGIASAKPFFQSKKGVLSRIEQFMWLVHNESSLLLNHMNISNHTSDEMMIARYTLLRPLPYGIVNDGAFIAGRAKKEGYSIKFCEVAQVKIEVPSRLCDIIEQRRRIIFGHLQVWNLVGKSPITVESMFFFRPWLSLKILVRTLAKSLSFLPILPFAGLSELWSLLLALRDFTKSPNKHRIWKRYGR
jgi:cellulose synthase/poly-beta-1,6-N-acetylglucosamine synthase-like glycosyltransferase